MSEAPERIWAWWDDAYDVGLLNEHGDKRYTPNDAKEYVRADRIEELEAKLAKAVEALEECVEEIDAYIQHQYPHDHPVQERHRQQDYASNPARLALAELTGGNDE